MREGGCIMLNLEVQGEELAWPFYVVEKLAVECVLGADLLMKEDYQLNHRERSARKNGSRKWVLHFDEETVMGQRKQTYRFKVKTPIEDGTYITVQDVRHGVFT